MNAYDYFIMLDSSIMPFWQFCHNIAVFVKINSYCLIRFMFFCLGLLNYCSLFERNVAFERKQKAIYGTLYKAFVCTCKIM